MLRTAVVKVKRRLAFLRGNGPYGLRTPGQFAATVRRERYRADRTRDRFSLLVFSPRDPDSADATLKYLASLLHRRLRCTDEVGWLNSSQIAAILPNTPPRGAWTVADDICLSFPYELTPPFCSVYTYPSDSSDDGTDSSLLEGDRYEPERTVQRMDQLLFRRLPPWKRGLDMVGAAVGLILLAPLFALVAAGIKLTSPGPVLFKQERAGLGGRRFWMYKFRSMVVDAEQRKADLMRLNEQDGPAFKIKDDPRVTRLGRFLRSTSIDELPQLWNVLRGEMSLVGPRPLPSRESDACTAWQRERLDVTPGLTCIWQVRGRSSVSFAEWVRMDLAYARRRTPAHDLKLILLTIPAVLLRKGAK